MTNQQKTILFWFGLVFAAILAVFLIVTIKQQLDTAPNTNQVSFTGEGRVSSKPDIAVVDFSIITEAATSKAAQDANSARSKKVNDFLKKQGVEDKDVRTTYYNITPRYSSPKPYPVPMPMMRSVNSDATTAMMPAYPIPATDDAKITGYKVTQSYQVKVRDFEKISPVVDGLVSAGANQVSNIYFDFENRESVLAEAREKAIIDAKDKADKLRKRIGIRLGKIVNYYESGYPGIYYAKGCPELEVGGAYDSTGPVLPPGENEIIVTVTITYQIK